MTSSAVRCDNLVHVYGTPFFIEAELPIDSARATTKFRRLMVAQDTGSAILGPARADLYFGAGNEAGRIELEAPPRHLTSMSLTQQQGRTWIE